MDSESHALLEAAGEGNQGPQHNRHLQVSWCPGRATYEIRITCGQSPEGPSFHFACSSQTLFKAIHSKNTFVAKSGSLSDFRKACSRIP